MPILEIMRRFSHLILIIYRAYLFPYYFYFGITRITESPGL